MLQECMKLKGKANAEHPYSDGLRLGDFLWIGGQFPIDQETGKIVGSDMKTQTAQAMNNIRCILKGYDLCMEHVMRLTIYMTDMSQYDQMNEAYAEFFDGFYPTRSVIGVNALPQNALIEIEGYALDTRALEVLCDEDTGEEDDCCDCSSGVCG